MSTRSRGSDFSRIRPARPASGESAAPPDHEGRRALFSAGERPEDAGQVGAVVVSCGGCGAESVLTPAAALRLAVPSLHLPYLKRGHGSWMRCPTCRQRTWVSVQIRLA